MLKMYANLLIEMLTNKSGYNGDQLDNLAIDDPQLKCILYECLHAQDKTLKREEELYHDEIKKFIEKEMAGENKSEDFEMRNQFKELVANQKAA